MILLTQKYTEQSAWGQVMPSTSHRRQQEHEAPLGRRKSTVSMAARTAIVVAAKATEMIVYV